MLQPGNSCDALAWAASQSACPPVYATCNTAWHRIKILPSGFLEGCSSPAAVLLRGNPITVEALRSAPGFAGYEARRRARTDKQLGGRVMGDMEAAFCEGADVEQWQHYKT